MNLESVRKDCVTETALRNLKRSFYSSLPASYVGNVMAEVVPKIGVDFAELKDIYHVKVYLPIELYFLDQVCHISDFVSY